MSVQFVSKLLERLTQLGIIEEQDIQGGTEDEIQDAMELQEVDRLPELYVAFLKVMGNGGGEFNSDTEMWLDSLPDIKSTAEDILEVDKVDFTLPKDAFVFLSYHGYQFMYFHTLSNDDDPPVYHYFEGQGTPPIKKFDHLSEFLTAIIAEQEGKEAQQQFLEENLPR